MKTHKKMSAGFAALTLKRNAGAAALAFLAFSLSPRAQGSEQIYFGGVSSSTESTYLNMPSNWYFDSDKPALSTAPSTGTITADTTPKSPLPAARASW